MRNLVFTLLLVGLGSGCQPSRERPKFPDGPSRAPVIAFLFFRVTAAGEAELRQSKLVDGKLTEPPPRVPSLRGQNCYQLRILDTDGKELTTHYTEDPLRRRVEAPNEDGTLGTHFLDQAEADLVFRLQFPADAATYELLLLSGGADPKILLAAPFPRGGEKPLE